MTISWTDLQTAIRSWVQLGTGLALNHVIWRDDDGPRPSLPYATLGITVSSNGSPWSGNEANPFTFNDLTVSAVDATTNTFTSTSHGLITGDGPVWIETTGTLPAPFEEEQDLYIIRVDADTVRFALTVGNAHLGTAIDITDTGTGTHSIVSNDETAHSGSEILYVSTGIRNITLDIQVRAASVIGATSARAILEQLVSKSSLPSLKTILSGNASLLNFGEIQTLSEVINQTHMDKRALLQVFMRTASSVSESATFIEFVGVDGEDDPLPLINVPSDPTP